MPRWKRENLKGEVLDLIKVAKVVETKEIKFETLTEADKLMSKIELDPLFREAVRKVRTAICFGYATNNLSELHSALTKLAETM